MSDNIIDFDLNRRSKRSDRQSAGNPGTDFPQSIYHDEDGQDLRDLFPGLAAFDFSSLPELTLFHWETDHHHNQETEGVRRLFLFLMSEENRAYFWSWTDGRFWDTVAELIIAGFSNYFFDKVRLYGIPINNMITFQSVFLGENWELPELESPEDLDEADWEKAEVLRQMHFCMHIPEDMRDIMEDFTDANFWLLTEFADAEVFKAGDLYMADEVDRTLPPITGAAEAEREVADKIRGSRVAFFDDRTYEYFKNRTDAAFWLLNYRAPLVSYRYQATGQSKPRGATFWLNMNAGRPSSPKGPKPHQHRNRHKRR